MMKKNNYLRWPIVFGFMLLGMTTFAQSKTVSTVTFAGGNYVSSYNGDISAIGDLLNTSDYLVIEEAKNRLKNIYQEINGGGEMSDAELSNLMKSNTSNYESWTAVHKNMPESASKQDKYLIRSLIVNIQKKM